MNVGSNENKIKIEEVLPAFEAKIRQKGKSSSRNALDQLRFIRAYCDHAGVSTIGELRADSVNLFKVHLLELGRSSRTVQANLGVLKHFTSWLLKTGKLRYAPLLSVERPDPKSDRRHERHMLLPSEWEWLVRGAMSADAHHELDADARVLLYRVTIQTGLRQNEIRSLNRGHFHLDGDEPFVKVFSGSTKNSQAAHQSIDKGLAADLREYLKSKLPKAPAFSLPHECDVADMLRQDLLAGRQLWLKEDREPEARAKREESDFLPVANEAGEKLDFHALRHTCGAWLAMRGVQSKVIQAVMRHSSITLTLDTYGHYLKGAESVAVASSASMTAMPELRATGTDGDPSRFHSASNKDARSGRRVVSAKIAASKNEEIPRKRD